MKGIQFVLSLLAVPPYLALARNQFSFSGITQVGPADPTLRGPTDSTKEKQ